MHEHLKERYWSLQSQALYFSCTSLALQPRFSCTPILMPIPSQWCLTVSSRFATQFFADVVPCWHWCYDVCLGLWVVCPPIRPHRQSWKVWRLRLPLQLPNRERSCQPWEKSGTPSSLPIYLGFYLMAVIVTRLWIVVEYIIQAHRCAYPRWPAIRWCRFHN